MKRETQNLYAKSYSQLFLIYTLSFATGFLTTGTIMLMLRGLAFRTALLTTGFLFKPFLISFIIWYLIGLAFLYWKTSRMGDPEAAAELAEEIKKAES